MFSDERELFVLTLLALTLVLSAPLALLMLPVLMLHWNCCSDLILLRAPAAGFLRGSP